MEVVDIGLIQRETDDKASSRLSSRLSGIKRAASESVSAYSSRFQLYCRMSSSSFGTTEWFSYNLSTSRESKKMKVTTKPKRTDPLNFLSSCAAVGSDICIFGGHVSPENKSPSLRHVYRLDTVTGEVSKRASMAVGRKSPRTAVVDGKIYVMGGRRQYMFSLEDQKQWAEVYDPILDKWEFLPPSASDVISNPFMITAVLHSEAKILVTQSGMPSIFFYNVKTQTWTVMDDDIPSDLCFSGQAVAIDQVIYCWDCGKLYAYHVYDHTLVLTTAAKIGLFSNEYACLETQPALLVHVDGHSFCLVWVNDGELHCVLFEASLSVSFGDCHYLKTSLTSHLVNGVDPLFDHANALFVDAEGGTINTK